MITTLVLAVALLAQSSPSAEEIATAVQQLADDDFRTREQASERLWRAGNAALPALQKAAESDDREVATRAKEVLRMVRLGVTPDTPPEMIALITGYHSGDLNQKRAVLQQLRQKKLQSTVIGLIRNEEHLPTRKQLAREFAIDGRQVAMEMLAAENEAVEEMLLWAASVDETGRGRRDYAAFLFVQGKLDDEVARLESAAGQRTDQDAARMLATLLQVQGRLREAKELAATTADKPLQVDILYRLEDWGALAAQDLLPPGQPVEVLGAQAAYYQLAGNRAGFAEAIEKLRALPVTNEDQAWLVSESLLINGLWSEAIEILSKWDRPSAVQILATQLRYGDAFKAAGIEDLSKVASWYTERAKVVASDNKKAWLQFLLGIRVARALHEVGESTAAAELLAVVGDLPADPDGLRTMHAFQAELRCGLREQAAKRAIRLLAIPSRAPAVMQAYFGSRGSWALHWWQMLRERAPESDPATTLEQVQAMFNPAKSWPLADETLVDLAGKLAVRAEETRETDPNRRAWRLRAIAELAAIRGDRKLAREYLEQAADPGKEMPAGPRVTAVDIVTPLMRLGDQYAEDNEWASAAAAYQRAWKQGRAVPLPLYLQGYALVQNGDEAEGRRLMKLAGCLPLGDPYGRHQLAQGLEERGLRQAAAEQRELVVRFGAPDMWAGNDNWYFRDSARLTGDYLEPTEPLRASGLWQRVLIGILRTNSYFEERRDYCQLFHVIHRVRARGLLEAGQVDKVEPELEASLGALPGNVDVVEQLRPKLIAAGQKEAAEKMFVQVYEAHERVCSEFPNSAQHHNNLAWLAARNDQRLDDALRHAETAVRLKPEAMGYVDTLAEVHFRRGEREKAVELAKQALAGDPQNKHLQAQLKRFSEP